MARLTSPGKEVAPFRADDEAAWPAFFPIAGSPSSSTLPPHPGVTEPTAAKSDVATSGSGVRELDASGSAVPEVGDAGSEVP